MSTISIHKTICSGNAAQFDQAISEELNCGRWDNYTFIIRYNGTENSFIAHIIFTQKTGG